MVDELVPFLVITVICWLSLKQIIAAARNRRQLDIVRHGRVSEGRVVGVQHPFLLDSYTRLYFDYVPVGSERPVRACHFAPRTAQAPRIGLPHMGSNVSVSYLPDHPSQAVILRLVSTAAGAQRR
jgi:hypothetical protein